MFGQRETRSQDQPKSAIVVLLNGVLSAALLSKGSQLRVERALSVWDQKSWIILSTGYTRYKPPGIDAQQFPILESRVGAKTLLDLGVPRSRILVEEASYDTIGNIYFVMLQFVQTLDLQTMTVVTSRSHIDRVRAVAEWICGLDGWQVVPRLNFHAAPDPEMDPEISRLLLNKEHRGLENVVRLRESIRSVSRICVWMQQEHACYQFDGQIDRLDPKLNSSY